jgi:hypothetical protein
MRSQRPSPDSGGRYREVSPTLPAWSERAMVALAPVVPAMARFTPEVLERTRLDLLHMLDMAAIAVVLGDESLMTEQVRWLSDVLAARAVPASALDHGLGALLSCQPRSEEYHELGRVLSAGRAALRGSGLVRDPSSPFAPEQR